MTESQNPKPRLRNGSEWAVHEDCIVGDEVGLRNLQKAIDEALRTGEYRGGDLDEWTGVQRVDSEWFEDPKDTTLGVGGVVIAAFAIVFLAVIAIGLGTVVRWAS